jgi:hypothetical protein
LTVLAEYIGAFPLLLNNVGQADEVVEITNLLDVVHFKFFDGIKPPNFTNYDDKIQAKLVESVLIRG